MASRLETSRSLEYPGVDLGGGPGGPGPPPPDKILVKFGQLLQDFFKFFKDFFPFFQFFQDFSIFFKWTPPLKKILDPPLHILAVRGDPLKACLRF